MVRRASSKKGVTPAAALMPAFLAGIGRSAAGEGGHVPMIPQNLTDREAATAWGRGRPCAHDQPDGHGRDRCG
jgi:hypothetical protein